MDLIGLDGYIWAGVGIEYLTAPIIIKIVLGLFNIICLKGEVKAKERDVLNASRGDSCSQTFPLKRSATQSEKFILENGLGLLLLLASLAMLAEVASCLQ